MNSALRIYPQMQRSSPLAMAVRRAIENRERTITDVAAALGFEVRQTLNARLSKQNPLQMDSPKDIELVRRIAKELDVDPQEIMDDAMRMARGEDSTTAPDINIVNVLLGTLRDPQSPEDRKDAAEAALRRLLAVD